jgi:hypothetical protein
MHAPPVWTGIWFAFVAAHSFEVVLVSRQFLLPDAEFMRIVVRSGAASHCGC